MKDFSEIALSLCFDDMNEGASYANHNGVIDTIAATEDFNNWTDSLCKDGMITEEQYNTFSYVGEFS